MDSPAIAAKPWFAPSRALQAIAEEAKADLPLMAIMLGYMAVVAGLCFGLGRPQFYHPDIYMDAWAPAMLTGSLFLIFLIELPLAVISNPRSPLTAFIARLRRLIHPRLVAGAVLFMVTGYFTGTFTSAKSLANDLVSFHADAMLADWDAALHLGVDPWRLLQPVLGHHQITRAIQHFYMSGWGTFLLVFTGMVAFWPRLAPIRNRFYLTYFACWIVLGSVFAALFMSGGPVYFGEITGDHARFAGQVRYLAFSDNLDNSSFELQQILWLLYERGQVHVGTGISAFPSLHVATMTLFTLTAYEIDRRAGWLMTAATAVILVGSVHLAWHYAIDGYASAAFVLAVWFGLKRLELRRAA